MIIMKKIRENVNNTGNCIGIVISDGKARVGYSMARNASKMYNPEGRCELCKNQQLHKSDEFNEETGIGWAVKRIISGNHSVAAFAEKYQKKIRPVVVEELRKFIFANDEVRKGENLTVPEHNCAERLLAEMLEMEERSIRYFK